MIFLLGLFFFFMSDMYVDDIFNIIVFVIEYKNEKFSVIKI